EEKEQLIMISGDVVSFKGSQQHSVREKIKNKIPDFDTSKLFLNAIHDHSSFSTLSTSKYNKMLVEKLSKVAISAWKNRKIGGISYKLEYAVIGHNRRVNYADGKTLMYGPTDRKDFIGLEGPSDPAVKLLFCWDLNEKL